MDEVFDPKKSPSVFIFILTIVTEDAFDFFKFISFDILIHSQGLR